MLFVFPLTKYNKILSPGFLGERFNNLQQAALLTPSVQYVLSGSFESWSTAPGHGELCGFNQSETGKNFEWITINNYSPKWRWIVVDIYWAAKREPVPGSLSVWKIQKAGGRQARSPRSRSQLIPLVTRSLLRSSSLTESLEQATKRRSKYPSLSPTLRWIIV